MINLKCMKMLIVNIFVFLKIRGLTSEENSGYSRYDFRFLIEKYFNNNKKKNIF
ncbi:hypothetical protein BCR36DRAFT_23505 [Piromyces finnis]|uniref:Uncharacterized protein n=1 Tax=Piromyces finnis TaxID=1754191 RepID=A0A1Y1VEW8_9FUNG|nr:hypothetical protein BCR36DRAFT_23505 [Piromyces finnis]|eukprot:ORX53275.1 hypothetical protein BCR36DRAFT_23505 [Piromyces finnis]